MTQPVLMIDSIDQAATMLKPLRIDLLRALAETRTCGELADMFGLTPQKAYYHVKTLERAGLVTREGERLVNGIAEGHYRSRAESYWLSPAFVRRLGGRQIVQDQSSLAILAGHAEQMLEDIGRLAERSVEGEHVPSLSLGVEVQLPSRERRAEFLKELSTTFEALVKRYAAPFDETKSDDSDDDLFRFTLSCYPKQQSEAA